MRGDFSAAERKVGGNARKHQDVKRLLNNFITQIKLHFDLTDEDIIEVLDSLLKSRRDKYPQKKWWQLWK